LLHTGPSRVEPDALALFLPPPPSNTLQQHPDLACSSPTAFSTTYDFAHLHGGDSSLHVILAPLDAALTIERGWAERFPLAGVGGWLPGNPEGRVLVYAPRDEGELRVVESLVGAGYEYMTCAAKV